MAETYRIHVGGHLDACWADWLGGLDIQHQEDGTTTLTGLTRSGAFPPHSRCAFAHTLAEGFSP